MQIETYIIVASMLMGWIATSFFLIKASMKAFARGFDRGVKLTSEQHAASPTCTIEDHELMTKITTSLGLAVDTWQAFPGTEIMVARVQPMKETIVPYSAESASLMFFSRLMNLMQSNHRRRHAA